MVGQNVGKYRILDRIGRGGMGTVYKAVDETLHREVAIKVLNAELTDPEVARRFRTEAITIARLSHPGIATIYELFEHEGEWLMVMEFVRGETLENMVARMGPLSAQRAAELCMQTLAALAHAHSMGVVHRDLKPANIMVTENGSVKVMDFGIARVTGSEHLTNAGFMMGTPAYMAPEQVKGGEIDARADLYAMGVVFYRLVTAKLPFKGDTAFAMVQSQVNDPPTPVGIVRSDLPPWVEEIVVRGLAKAPEDRFQSAVELHEAFARCLAGLPLSSMYGPAGDNPLTPSRPMPTGAFAIRTGQTLSTPVQMSGSHPTHLSGGTHPGGVSASDDPTVLTPAGGRAMTGAVPSLPTSAQPQVTGAAGVPAGAQAATAPKAKSTMPLLIAAAVLVVGGVIGGVMMFGGSAEETAPSTQAEAATPSPEPTPQAGDPGQVSNAEGGATPPGTTATGGEAGTPPPARAAAQPAAPPAAAAPSTARARSTPTPTPSTKPAAPGAATPTPASAPPPTSAIAAAMAAKANDRELATFPSVKLYTVTNKRTTDRDVIINFINGEIQIVPKTGGAAVASVPYNRIRRATYVRGRDPKWDESIPGPGDGLDVGTFMRQSRHWLVVQGSVAVAVLRLEDSNFRQVLEMFELRTGVKIDRRNE